MSTVLIISTWLAIGMVGLVAGFVGILSTRRRLEDGLPGREVPRERAYLS